MWTAEREELTNKRTWHHPSVFTKREVIASKVLGAARPESVDEMLRPSWSPIYFAQPAIGPLVWPAGLVAALGHDSPQAAGNVLQPEAGEWYTLERSTAKGASCAQKSLGGLLFRQR
jgi:hypothetical protein